LPRQGEERRANYGKEKADYKKKNSICANEIGMDRCIQRRQARLESGKKTRPHGRSKISENKYRIGWGNGKAIAEFLAMPTLASLPALVYSCFMHSCFT
jgi:hypothetical protein